MDLELDLDMIGKTPHNYLKPNALIEGIICNLGGESDAALLWGPLCLQAPQLDF